MQVTKKHLTLGISLAATLLAVYFSPSAEGTDIALSEQVQARTANASSRIKASVALPLAKQFEVLNIRSRLDEEGDEAELFASTDWNPPPVVVQKPVSASQNVELVSAPTAPPLPFQVLGRYAESGTEAVFLQYNDQNLVVRVGDTIAEQYKVESLNGGTLTFRYIPLNVQQTLDVGGAT